MSVWTEFDGTLTIHKKEHFSFLKYVEDFFEAQCILDYTKPTIKTSTVGSYYKTHFCMSICESNIEAVERMYISALLYDGAELYNKTSPRTQYPGDGYLDMFENIPCAKSYNGKLVDIQEELRQETKSEVLREIWEAKECNHDL